MAIAGFATASGTETYRARFSAADAPGGPVAPGHFRARRGVWLSSIGLGTYLGESDDATDRRYGESIERALALGCNVIDTAINYRHQRSERAVGRALARLFAAGRLAREEIFVASKCGFIPYDGNPPRSAAEALAWFKRSYLDPGFCRASDVVAGAHCLAPAFIRHEIEASRANLGLETIDLYYLHNPEFQLQAIGHDRLMERLRDGFAVCEEAVAAGRIRSYGVATWNAFRARRGSQDALEIAELVALAGTVGGKGHHFAAIQLPYAIGMPQAFTDDTQRIGDRAMSAIAATAEFELATFTSATLMQRQLTRDLPPIISDVFPRLDADAQRAIQFARSTPGVGTALVGMSTVAHAVQNLATARVPPTPRERFMSLFVQQ